MSERKPTDRDSILAQATQMIDFLHQSVDIPLSEFMGASFSEFIRNTDHHEALADLEYLWNTYFDGLEGASYHVTEPRPEGRQYVIKYRLSSAVEYRVVYIDKDDKLDYTSDYEEENEETTEEEEN